MNLESFLHEMRENPEDVALRLVFADWLEDGGEHDRAELIRLQLAAVPRAPWDGEWGSAGTPREDELIDRITARWLGDAGSLHGDGIDLYFRHGMGQMQWRCDRPATIERGFELVRSGWVERFQLEMFDRDTLAGLVPDLGGVHWLALSGWFGSASELVPFLSRMTHLRRLELRSFRDESSDLVRCLLRFPRLDWLGWSPLGAGRPQLERLLPLASRCRSLLLDESAIGNDGLAVILGGLVPDRLHTLSLRDAQLTRDGIERLAGCDELASLRALNLSSNAVGDAGAIALARSPHLRKLRHLALADAGIGTAGVEALAGSPLLSNVVTLDLGGQPIRKEGADALAASPHLGNLVRLSLRNCSVGLSVARALVLSGHLPALTQIDLSINPIDQVRHSDRMTLDDWRTLCRFSAAHAPSPEELREMLQALRSGPAPVRRHVAPRIERRWREDHSGMPAEAESVLVLALADPDGLVRRCAAVALTAVAPGVGSIPSLAEILDSANQDAVEFALRILAGFGLDAKESEPAILRALARRATRDETLPARALAAVGATSPAAERAFRRWVGAEQFDLCKSGALGLARLQVEMDVVLTAWRRIARGPQKADDALLVALGGWPLAVEEVLRHVDDAEVETRSAVADVLAHAHDPREPVLAAFVALLGDDHPSPRSRACESIRHGGWRSPVLVLPLANCLATEGLERPAIQALRTQGPLAAQAVPHLLEAGLARRLHDAFLLCRDLGESTQAHADAFRDALRREEVVAARLARMALRLCARNWPDAESILSKWQEDPSERVRLAVDSALVELRSVVSRGDQND